jgi:DNA-binding protein HU-beta
MVKSRPTVSTSKLIAAVGTQINEVLSEKKLSIPKKIVKDIIQGFLNTIEESVAAGKKLRLDRVGILQVKNRAARMGRNPQTGEEIKIPASKKIAFRASKSLKEQVTGNRATKKPAKKAAKKK